MQVESKQSIKTKLITAQELYEEDIIDEAQ